MKRSAAVLPVLVALALVGCRGGTKQPTTVKLGVFEPMTGANAAGGAMEVEGVKLANELYPSVKVGDKEYKIDLVVVDNKSDKVEAANAAQRLVDQDKVNVVLGSWGSSLSMAAGPIVKDKKIPAVAMSATNPLVTKGNDFYFRVCFIDPFQGTVMANYAAKDLKAKKAVIIREVSNDYSVGLARFFADSFKKLTADPAAILAELNYNTNDQDFTAQLTTVKSMKPDVIFAPGNYTESALIIKQARELGITAPFLGGDTWEAPEFIDVGRQAVEGAVLSTFFATEVPITPTSKEFLDAYRKKYQKEPAAVTALGFDGYLVARAAIERAGSLDGTKIRDALLATQSFPGAAGLITFDQDRNATKSAVIKVVKDGKFTYLTTVQPQ
ncbi:ABC transporter substrate-binding protein [Anaeromyxobacter diazotrophicus]|uniref:Branched-chain amino acid ABC transporter substrate-binding protein n=1 Tax=Anaeromyxobacter diazotrophicus TaxID=2590199 RepID=A0A7I9VKD7_9BACT|nr:ABC transporter substrate-binding protein [Anaeromyxobacter diazotrophicus]GEJ56477.1 branched-chain amino acid ABC transporter substrate-binding protein [Anaeromyxobacter diazotrophicus]